MLRKMIPLFVGLLIAAVFLLLAPQLSSPPMPVVLANSTEVPLIRRATPIPGVLHIASIDNEQYTDDRSNPVSLLRSYFSALNNHKLIQAQSYWQSGSKGDGFIDLLSAPEDPDSRSVKITAIDVQLLGIWLGNLNGQLRYTVSLFLRYENLGGVEYIGCYEVTPQQSGVAGVSRFRPMAITEGILRPIILRNPVISTESTLCKHGALSTGQPLPLDSFVPGPGSSASTYLDDKTDAEQVLRSYYNAIERQEFTRAYSYWDEVTVKEHLSGKNEFDAQVHDLEKLDISIGTVISKTTKYNTSFYVPVGVVGKRFDGEAIKLVVCYWLAKPEVHPVIHDQDYGLSTPRIISYTLTTLPAIADPAYWIPAVCRPELDQRKN